MNAASCPAMLGMLLPELTPSAPWQPLHGIASVSSVRLEEYEDVVDRHINTAQIPIS